MKTLLFLQAIELNCWRHQPRNLSASDLLFYSLLTTQMAKFFLQRWGKAFLLLAVSFLLMLPAIFKGVPRGNDLEHHYRTSVGLYQSIHSRQLYPRWNSLATEGYGDLSFRFYPPLFYYLMCLTRWLTGDWYAGSFLAFTLLLFVGGLGVYFWTRSFLPANVALCAALLSLVTPYHVNQLYQASMLPEYAACAFLPFSFAFVERLCQTGKSRHVIGLGLSYAVLILTHLPLTVIGSIALAIYGVLRIRKSDYVKSILRLSLAVLLGLAASAFYWLTMVAELSWMRGNKINPLLWFDYRYNFLFGNALEGSTSWWANIMALATLLTILPAVVLLKNRKSAERKNHPALTATLVLTGFSFFMMVPFSRPIWDALAFLQEVQFPWRWLSVTAILCPALTAASLPGLMELAQGRFRPMALLAAGCLLIPISLTLSQVIRSATYISRPEFAAKVESIASTPGLSDFRPIWTNEQPRPMTAEIEAQERTVDILLWQAEQRRFQISEGNETEARAKTFYYPHWLATADGKRLATRPDADGALLISLPAKAASVELVFQEPSRVAYANAVSIFAWLLLGVGSVLALRKPRKSSVPPEIEELTVNRL
jgi:hypothetical protein